ncbi:MAG: ABC transporter ATP-binding protein, partial [Lachnospiraceae bacterium]|nr:ABC transporter ATP-binding protein [Lachnospiraceae bacterium]
ADRCRYNKKSWIRYFSGVLQDVGVFPMSVEENLAPGEEGNEERMWQCLEMADLDDRVRRLPGGLKTMFGKEAYEDAVDFSGGEKQKLMLARALYKPAPMLVLDEPTAALDPLMESELYEQYCRFSEHKTSVFISHRLASTRFCDRVLLMEAGRIIEEGTHEQLLEKDGRYAWMFRLQSKYYQQQEAGLEGEEVEV